MRKWKHREIKQMCSVTQLTDVKARTRIRSGSRVPILIYCVKDDKPRVEGKSIIIRGFFFFRVPMPILQFQMFACLFILKETLRWFRHWPHIENHKLNHFNHLPTWHSGGIQPTAVLLASIRTALHKQVRAMPEGLQQAGMGGFLDTYIIVEFFSHVHLIQSNSQEEKQLCSWGFWGQQFAPQQCDGF